MNAKEIIGNYPPPHKCNSQCEFDRIMQELNAEQTHLNHPYLDRDRELAKQRELLILQRKSIEIQLRTIRVERIELEQKRKEINRAFHDLKHEFIMLNPIGQFAGKDDECQAG